MRDKKRFISAILLTTVMLFAAGCGKQAKPVSAEPAEPVKGAETEKWNTDLHKKVNRTIDEESIEDSMEGSEDDTIAEDGAAAEDNVDVREEIVAEETESTKIESTETISSENTSSGTTSEQSVLTDTAPTDTAPAQSAPAHEHTWVAHNATTQTWIPNIVVVDDYEYRVTGRTDDLAICDCGFQTTDANVMAQHVKDEFRAGGSGGFTIQPGHDVIEEVRVGSHEEDHGHYETSTYVDYYYCECGATKN